MQSWSLFLSNLIITDYQLLNHSYMVFFDKSFSSPAASALVITRHTGCTRASGITSMTARSQRSARKLCSKPRLTSCSTRSTPIKTSQFQPIHPSFKIFLLSQRTFMYRFTLSTIISASHNLSANPIAAYVLTFRLIYLLGFGCQREVC